jgi:acyl-CoA synthetase (AMP-forming)/AMP-acid ligase II
VPILLPTGTAFIEALLGSMLAGAVPVPLAMPMTFGSIDRYLRNLAAIVEDSGSRLAIASPRLRDGAAKDDDLRRLLRDVLVETDLGPSTASPSVSVSSSDPAFLQYTSGTTGHPKGAIISHGALVANAFAIAHGLAIGPSDVGVSWLPLFHDMGLIGVLLTAICHPYPLHLISPESFVMSPRKWLDLIGKTQGTLCAAPNFAYDLAVARGGDAAGLALGSLRVTLNGAEPVHAATVARFVQKFAPAGYRSDAMMPVYGLAENTLAVAFPSLSSKLDVLEVDRESLEQRGRIVVTDGAMRVTAISVGGPVAGTTIEIVRVTGALAEEREVGEVLVSSPSLMTGYFRNDEASLEALAGGKLHTGDLGFVDGGRLFITGRAKELVIKGGKNIYPYDVERIAGEVDGVRQGSVAAFGRANGDTGTDDLVVIVETVHGDGARREGIAKAVRGELLASLGVKADDVRVCGVGAIPRTTSGKIRRRACADLFPKE